MPTNVGGGRNAKADTNWKNKTKNKTNNTDPQPIQPQENKTTFNTNSAQPGPPLP